MRNNFFDNIYDFIAKTWKHVFAIIGFAAAGAAILLGFIGGLTMTEGKEFLYYFVDFLFEGALLAGVVLGFYRNNRRMLFGSFIGFFTLLFAQTCVGAFSGLSWLSNAEGAYIAYWVFDLFYGLAVGAYLVFLVLVYLFGFKGLEKVLHYVYLAVFPFGVLAWILGIVAAASGDVNWTTAIVPLLEAAAFLFFPAVLALGTEAPQKKEEPAPAPQEEAKEEKKEEPVEPEVQEEK